MAILKMKKSKKIKILLILTIVLIVIISIPYVLKEIKIWNAKTFFWKRIDEFEKISKTLNQFQKISDISKNDDNTFNVISIKYKTIDSNRQKGYHINAPILSITADSLNKYIYNIEHIENGLTLLKLDNYVSNISIDPYYINIKTNDIIWRFSYKKSKTAFNSDYIKLESNWELEPLYKNGKFEY